MRQLSSVMKEVTISHDCCDYTYVTICISTVIIITVVAATWYGILMQASKMGTEVLTLYCELTS